MAVESAGGAAPANKPVKPDDGKAAEAQKAGAASSSPAASPQPDTTFQQTLDNQADPATSKPLLDRGAETQPATLPPGAAQTAAPEKTAGPVPADSSGPSAGGQDGMRAVSDASRTGVFVGPSSAAPARVAPGDTPQPSGSSSAPPTPPGSGSLLDQAKTFVGQAVDGVRQAEATVGAAVQVGVDQAEKAAGQLVQDVQKAGAVAGAVTKATVAAGEDLVGRAAQSAGDFLKKTFDAVNPFNLQNYGADGKSAQRTIDDPMSAISRLNSDGDTVNIAQTAEGKLTVPVEGIPLGGKVQSGSTITVQQVGGAQPDGTGTATPGPSPSPKFVVNYSRNGQAGIIADFKPKSLKSDDAAIEFGAERNLRTADQVSMTFDTREDAARAVKTIQQTEAADRARDALNANAPNLLTTLPGLGSLGTIYNGVKSAENPLADGSLSGKPDLPDIPTVNDLIGLPNPGDQAFDALKPSQADQDFLNDHLTSFTQSVGGQERNKVGGKFSALGVDIGGEGRGDLNNTLTRTVTLPQDGKPSSVTYRLSGEKQVTGKDKLQFGGETKIAGKDAKGSVAGQTIGEPFRASTDASLTYDVPPGADVPLFGNRPIPEGSIDFDKPSSMSVGSNLDVSNQPLLRPDGTLDTSRTDQTRYSERGTTNDPAHDGALLVAAVLGQDKAALAGLGKTATVTKQTDQVDRDGINIQPEIGPSFAGVEVKGSEIINVGNDDVVHRDRVTLTPTPTLPAPVQAAPPPRQQVVLPRDGLNVRALPGLDGQKVGALQNGTFVQPTGGHWTDATGRQWSQVSGLDDGDHAVQGWVASDQLRDHPAGAMDGTGRTAPALERPGYSRVPVRPGDNLWDIAKRTGAKFNDILSENGEHVIDPSLIFPGDTVYVPVPAAAN